MKKNKKKKQIFYSLLGLFGLLVVLFGTTYAIFTYSKEGTTENVVTAGTIDLSYLTDTGNNIGISLTEAYPVSDSVAMVSTNPDNIFDFTLSGQNDGNTDIPFEVTLEKTDISDLPEDVVKVYLTDITESDEEEILEPTLYSDLYTSVFKKEEVVEEKVIYQGKIEANTTYNKTLRLRMWVKEDIDFDSGDYDELTFDTIVNIYSDSTTSITNICDIEPGQVWNFDYTGSEQTFKAPCSGNYKLETWGAQGGFANIQAGTRYMGGYGGYSTGTVNLNYLTPLYIYNGGAGENSFADSNPIQIGGYNGGGGASVRSTASGGGASHIAITSRGELSNYDQYRDEILIVSGGGGGAAADNAGGGFCIGGNAGGFKGPDPIPGATTYYNFMGGNYMYGFGGTQTSGYTFGLGQSGVTDTNLAASGGGGGFYGGTSGNGTTWTQCSGGGSSYIGNSLLTDKVMYCNNCTESNEESTKTISTTCHNINPTANCAKEGSGYTKITYLGNN